MEADFRALLLSSTAVTDVVGQRIHWGVKPQGGAFPCVVLNAVTERVEYTYSGAVDLERSRVQIDCYATSHKQATDLSRVIKNLISGYSGTVGNTAIEGIFLIDRSVDFEAPESGDEAVARDMRDIYIHHYGV